MVSKISNPSGSKQSLSQNIFNTVIESKEKINHFYEVHLHEPIRIPIEGTPFSSYQKVPSQDKTHRTYPTSSVFPRNWHLGEQGQEILKSIHPLAKAQLLLNKYSGLQTELDARFARPISYLGSKGEQLWMTSSQPIQLNSFSTLLLAETGVSALEFYQKYGSRVGVDDIIPDHAYQNQIRIGDLLPDLDILLARVRGDIQMVNEEMLAFHSDRGTDFQLRKNFLNAKWKVLFATTSSVQRMSATMHLGGMQKFAIIDSFTQWVAAIHPGTNHPRPSYRKEKGFASALRAFSTLRAMARAIENEFAGLGDRFIHWMVNPAFNLVGWDTWSDKDFEQRAQAVFGEKQGFLVFADIRPEHLSYATTLINTIALLTQITRNGNYAKIMDGEKVVNSFSPTYLATIMSNYVSVLSDKELGNFFSKDYWSLLRDENSNSEGSQSGGYSRWRHFTWTTALLMESLTDLCQSIYSIGGPQTQIQSTLEASFNNYMKTALTHYSEDLTWYLNEADKWRLSDYSTAYRYFGARNHENRYLVPFTDGNRLLEFDSDMEAWVAYMLTHIRMPDGESMAISIGSLGSGVINLAGAETIRKMNPITRPRKHGIDREVQTWNTPKPCYPDLIVTFSTGQTVFIEHLGQAGQYGDIKNLDTRAYNSAGKATLFCVQLLRNENYYLNNPNSGPIGFSNPLADFNVLHAFFSIMHRNGALENLPMNLAIDDAVVNPEVYWISQVEADIVAEKFMVGPHGSVDPDNGFWNSLFRWN